jgi:hypothetical protein
VGIGHTVEFWFSENRDLLAVKRFLRKASSRRGWPKRIVVDGSQTNREAIVACDVENRLSDRSPRVVVPIRIRQSQYLNNRIEQDHRRIKRRAPATEFQIVRCRSCHLGRHRDGSCDAKAATPICLQSKPFAQGTIRGHRRLKSTRRLINLRPSENLQRNPPRIAHLPAEPTKTEL